MGGAFIDEHVNNNSVFLSISPSDLYDVIVITSYKYYYCFPT